MHEQYNPYTEVSHGAAWLLPILLLNRQLVTIPRSAMGGIASCVPGLHLASRHFMHALSVICVSDLLIRLENTGIVYCGSVFPSAMHHGTISV